MKQIFLLIVVVVVGILAYQNFFAPTSEEVQEVKTLEAEFEAAVSQLHQAGRSAGLSGMDTTAEAESAVIRARRVQDRLEELKDRLEEESALDRADKLEARIAEFLKQNDAF